jgi:hypothetical protein
MHNDKFVDWTKAAQIEAVKARFQYRKGAGWFTPEGIFAGKNETDVIGALIDLEEAEINAIGDCMGGCCMVSPQLGDFVRNS